MSREVTRVTETHTGGGLFRPQKDTVVQETQKVSGAPMAGTAGEGGVCGGDAASEWTGKAATLPVVRSTVAPM
jgi:hypothetical protein